MKLPLIVLSALLFSVTASAQKHACYADIGISGAQFDPGFSLTYNYMPAKFFGFGIGTQGNAYFPTMVDDKRFVKDIYADVRLTAFAAKKNRVLTFFNLGLAMYNQPKGYGLHDNMLFTTNSTTGTYIGLGLGYFRAVTKKGWGPYLTVKMIGCASQADSYNLITGERKSGGYARGTLILSLGFKFDDMKEETVRRKKKK